MAEEKNDRVAGMVWGALAADALALGAHWVYDQEELEKTFGRVTDYKKPLKDSYHPKKKAGEQTHYGDQSLVLLESLTATKSYDAADFSERWRKSWTGYKDYLDHATKDTLANLERGVAAGSDSEELGGAARIAPLLAAMSSSTQDEKVAAARGHASLTHASPIALDAAEFLTRVAARILEGGEIRGAVTQAATAYYEVLPVRDILRKVAETRTLETKAAAKELGLACPAEQALPTVLALLVRYPDDLETAFIENVMAGRDSAARGLALGMILGAKHGKAGIPERWVEELKARKKVEKFLEGLA